MHITLRTTIMSMLCTINTSYVFVLNSIAYFVKEKVFHLMFLKSVMAYKEHTKAVFDNVSTFKKKMRCMALHAISVSDLV